MSGLHPQGGALVMIFGATELGKASLQVQEELCSLGLTTPVDNSAVQPQPWLPAGGSLVQCRRMITGC
ncbi:hypothetical protein DPMN_108854 [Dreissena polymorpha]|uniref:Uncharacterized protein n=1 Tax=Dreissena polymorpha TaxID=45954 RepID=A0A9D4QLE1_DREPO|nr:hypothetical protein DPMN_108854 [Dreissena polymorpha]